MEGDVPFWFPVVTLVVGALGTFAANLFRDTRSHRLQREAVRSQIQREALLQLQDATEELVRTTTLLVNHLLTALEDTGRWPFAADLDAIGQTLEANSKTASWDVRKHSTRVLNGDVRQLADRLHGACTDAVLQPAKLAANHGPIEPVRQMAWKLREDLSRLGSEANDQIGEELRGII